MEINENLKKIWKIPKNQKIQKITQTGIPGVVLLGCGAVLILLSLRLGSDPPPPK